VRNSFTLEWGDCPYIEDDEVKIWMFERGSSRRIEKIAL
jgi:hypothetical protein